MKDDFFNDDFFNEEFLTEDLLDEDYLNEDNLDNVDLDEEFISSVLDNPNLSEDEIFQILNENDQDKSKQIAENLLKFNEASKLAEERDKANKQLEEHASINAGYHDYEQNSFMTKRKLSDLCTLYRVFFENDPEYSEFLNQVKEYADLDSYKHDDYEAEMELVKQMPEKITEMLSKLDAEEKRFNEEVNRTLNSRSFKNASPEEKRKINHKFLIKSEVLDNRRRALASFENYFENMSKGDLYDLDDPNNGFYSQDGKPVSIKEEITSINKNKNLVVPEQKRFLQIKDDKPATAYYINASGVKLDASFDLNRYRHKGKKIYNQMTEANNNIYERDMRNSPIFPHEPRMTDVSQAATGNCYMLACLQNIARLYPQKIKDMIKDNGDGTATVRLFTREKSESGNWNYNPVYVRVDKTIPAINSKDVPNRLAEDCLWVNLIEKAYAMSGLHESYNTIENIPINPADEKNKDWRPSVTQIEGGKENIMMENLLGKEAASKSYAVPILNDKSLSYDPEKLKDVDLTNAESIVKHIYYNLYKAANGTIPEKEFLKLSKDDVINYVKTAFESSEEFKNTADPNRLLFNLYDNLLDKQESVFKKRLTDPDSTAYAEKKFNDAIKNFNTWYRGCFIKNKDQLQTHKKTMSIIEQGIFETNFTEKNLENAPKKEDFYETVSNALDKGFIISFGSKSKIDVDLIHGGHAYSIIGSYKTDDVPPEYYFRVKNPWTKHTSGNGLEYVNENGKTTGKWVNVKDGIFDMKLEDLVHETDYVHINGSEELANTPHMKTEGYDIITPEAAKKNEKSKVSADLLTDCVKVANELYDAMVSTNSFFSMDSPEYKALVDGIKEYRHNLAQSFGRDIKDMKKLTEPLKGLIETYETHVEKGLGGPSNRQKARKKVCKDLRDMVDAIEAGKNPQQEVEKTYAKKLALNYYLNNNRPLPDNIDEVAKNLYNNKAFRKIANSSNISNLNSPSEEQIKKHITSIEKSLKGRGRDKNVDIDTIAKEKPKGPVMG